MERNTKNSSLCEAVKSGDLSRVKALLKEGKADPNEDCGAKMTPLHIAAREGYLEIVKCLVESGADLDVQDTWDRTPLFYAADSHPEVALYLIERGADVKKGSGVRGGPLHLAASKGYMEVVRALVERGANPNDRNSEWNRTPLHIAAEKGYADVVKYLLEKGADVNKKDKDGATPLHLAAQRGHLEVVKVLVEAGANLKAKDSITRTTPLHRAASAGHLKVVEYLLERGAKISLKGDLGTPLHYAAYDGHLDVVKYLIGRGAKASYKDGAKRTPLHFAAASGHLDVVKYLVEEAGADLNAKDEWGRTPLHEAVFHLDVVKYLVEHGADVMARDENGLTPLEEAARRSEDPEVVKYLWSRVEGTGEGPSIHGVARNGHLELVKALISAGTDVNVKDDYGATPLHYAAEGNSPEVVKYLLEMGADVHAKDDMGKTPLHYAAEGSSIDEKSDPHEGPTPDEERRIEVMRILIEKGADVNAKDDEGKTPLHHVISMSGPFKVARYLVDRGTDINAKDEEGYTPLDGAELMANDELVEYLLKRGAKRGEEI